MASITQTVDNYVGGISQQPDERKIPGQVVEAKNVLPDVTQGLLKRPGGKLITSLYHNEDDGVTMPVAYNPAQNGKWFHYYRDETEQYIGQVSRTGNITMWRCSDGQAMVVTYDSGTSTALTDYLTHTNDEDIQTLTLNDYTYLTNRTKTTAMNTGVCEPVRPHEAFVELKQIKYSSQYGLEIYNNNTTTTLTTATRLNVTFNQSDSGSGAALKTSGTCDSVGTQIFGAAETDTGSKKNLYFRITTNGQPTTEGNSATPVYKCRYQVKCDLLYGGEGWSTGDTSAVQMTTPVHNSNYTVTVAESSTSNIKANLALVRPTPSSFDGDTVVTADGILGEIRQAIVGNATATSGNGFTVEQIGTGLYITRTDGSFNVSTPASELLNVLTDSVQNVADLPKQCKHGYVVKVRNSEADEDDYYVKFVGKNNNDGPGTWEECPQPGRTVAFNKATMPIQLIRTNAYGFDVKQVDWADCLVGDTTTAPEPSFIGKSINKLLFWRNRLVALSDENVIMSQPGEFFNFWPKSAITYTPQDVIDISCSSTYPAVVYDGIEINSGLVLFTKNQQFMVTTDSDILSPLTAKINSLSTYNFNYRTNPISLGTTIAFLDNAGKYSRFWEMSSALREGEPDIVDQTKVVSKLFDQDLIKISNSRENSVVFFSQKDSKTLYGFRYFTTNQKRMQQAWFTWTLPGKIQHHCVLDDALYVILEAEEVQPGTGGYKWPSVMLKYSLKLDSNGHYIDDNKGTTTDLTDDVTYRVHLDNSTKIPSSSLSAYDSVNKRTTFTLPDGFNNIHQESAYTRSGTTITVTNSGTYPHGLSIGDSIIIDFNSTGGTNGTYVVQTVPTASSFTVTDTVSGTITSNTCYLSYHQLAVYMIPAGSDTTFQGRSENVTTYLDGATIKVSLPGNWKTYDPQFVDDGNPADDITPTNDLILGYQFDMKVKFPTFYVTTRSGQETISDTNGSLILHRLKMNMGPSGLFKTTIDRTGKPSYTETWEPTIADSYGANRVQVNDTITQTIPVYERNKHLNVTLESTHPTPTTLYSLTWQGDYTNNYYKRV